AKGCPIQEVTVMSNEQKNVSVMVEKPGFFGELAEAIIALFGPTHDDYPVTGFQPFTGELSRKH
ncbi:MAG: hypothetical protein AAFQ89_13980, partial [Cyanobacteria bacterium J06626_18]